MESLPWERKKWEMELVFRNVSDGAGTHVKGRRVGGPVKLMNFRITNSKGHWTFVYREGE